MYRIIFVFMFLLAILGGVYSDTFKQERAKILYENPKYVRNVSVFTFRVNRRSPYLTSLNVTSLIAFGDDITIRFEFSNSKFLAYPVRFDFKTCEGMKFKWAREWAQAYTDVPLNICPVPPGSYHFSRFEMPPKNFPFQFNNMDYIANCTTFVTATKEKILELSVQLKFSNKD